MIKRCIEISSGPAHISVSKEQLIISREGKELGRIPLEDIGVVVLHNPSITCTHVALQSFMAHKVAVVVCGKDHHPAGMLLPMEGHSIQAEIMCHQASAGEVLKRRLWRDIVRQKIRNQAMALSVVGMSPKPLDTFASKVKAGDSDNMEGRTSRLYWTRLFGKNFRRDRYGGPPNALLNYGYMVVRAALARAVCGSGLHPSFGIHHRNRYNAFALVDDLIEPLRPLVDIRVYRLWADGKVELTKDVRAELLSALSHTVEWNGQDSPLMVAMQRYTASLRKVYTGEQKELDFPLIKKYK